MQAPSDLITTIKLTAAEYLRWQEVAVERFRDVPGLSAILLEMQQNENLYNFVAQKRHLSIPNEIGSRCVARDCAALHGGA